MRATRKWLLFAAWLGVGALYEDTLVPMRTDLEIARFDKELTITKGSSSKDDLSYGDMVSGKHPEIDRTQGKAKL